MEQIFIQQQVEEIAQRWQIPMERVEYFIRELGMPVEDDEARGNWFVAHLALVKQEQQKAYEAALFPAKHRGEPPESLESTPGNPVRTKRSGRAKAGNTPQPLLSPTEELAHRWQLPVETIETFIRELGMPVADDEARGNWFVAHADLVLAEQQKQYETSLFPGEFRPEPSEPPA